MTDVRNPTTGEVLFTAARTPAGEAAEHIRTARAAQPEWAALGALGRGARLAEAARRIAADAEMAGLIVSDVGKPVAEAGAEVTRTARIFEYAGSLGAQPVGEVYEDSTGAHIRVIREPRGVAVLVTPWNFPAAIPAWKLAPALQAGNAVCIKPATQAVRVAERLVSHLHAAGVPEELLRLVPGGAETANGLLDAGPDAVSFTGSTQVGRAIHERLAGRFIPVQLEMGGKNGVYVGPSADPATAAKVALAGAMGYAGQKCTATSLLFVHEAAEAGVRAELARQAAELPVGDPGDPATVVGPLIDAGKRDEVAQELVAAASRGAVFTHGGEALARPGAVLAPTLVDAPPGDPLGQEELFAPVLAVQPVGGPEEAVTALNALPYGLVAGIVSTDRKEIEAFAHEIEAGIVRVNAPTTGVEPHVPFGGAKESSFGPREQGRAGLEFFSETKTIYG